MRLFILTLVSIALLANASRADIYVIVNSENPIDNISKKELIDIFMGRTKSFNNGTRAYTIDQPNKSEIRAVFYKSLTGKSVSYVNAYWARLFYTGRTRPPANHFKNSQEIIEEVSKNVNAIAYIDAEKAPPNTKAVLVLPVKK